MRSWGWALATAVVLIVGTPRHSAAQSEGVQEDSLLLSDTKPSATLTVGSEVWLALDCGATRDSTAEPADPVAAAWRNTSSCLVPWLSGFPQHVTLAPTESQRTLVVQVIPPATLPDGRYTARMIWAMPFGSNGVQHGEVAVIYEKGPHPSRASHMRWRATASPGGTVTLIGHTPDVVVLDDRTPRATVTLTNPAAVPTDVWLTLDCPWFHFNTAGRNWSQFEMTWHQAIPNATLWLGGFPQHVVLAPHERRTLPIEIVPFPDLAAGSYYARLVYVQAPVLMPTASGDTMYTTPGGTIDIVYHRGAVPLQLTLGSVQVTRQPDGTSRACLTVQRPGIGVVVTVHAEVNDAQGRPVRPRTVGMRGAAGGRPAAWSLDTTVYVQVRRNGYVPESVAIPTPLCFPLPVFAPGHDRLAVTATALEDKGRHRAVQAIVPFDVP